MLASLDSTVRCRPLLATAQVEALSRLLREEFGVPFRIYDGST
jgi:hypothetical protein